MEKQEKIKFVTKLINEFKDWTVEAMQEDYLDDCDDHLEFLETALKCFILIREEK